MGLLVAICRCGWAGWAVAWGRVVWAILGELMAQKKAPFTGLWCCGWGWLGAIYALPLLALVALS